MTPGETDRLRERFVDAMATWSTDAHPGSFDEARSAASALVEHLKDPKGGDAREPDMSDVRESARHDSVPEPEPESRLPVSGGPSRAPAPCYFCDLEAAEKNAGSAPTAKAETPTRDADPLEILHRAERLITEDPTSPGCQWLIVDARAAIREERSASAARLKEAEERYSQMERLHGVEWKASHQAENRMREAESRAKAAEDELRRLRPC